MLCLSSLEFQHYLFLLCAKLTPCVLPSVLCPFPPSYFFLASFLCLPTSDI